LSSPIVIHMHRPYASEEEYIAHERFSIEPKSMLLIDQPPLPLDTSVVFDVTLDNGQKPIRAEAKVVGYVEPEGDRPGGLRVRFRRFGSATKAFIERAVNGEPPPAAASVPDNATLGAPLLEASSTAAPALGIAVSGAASALQTSAALLSTEPSEPDQASGIHTKTAAPVVAPANRDALLARLRGRRVG